MSEQKVHTPIVILHLTESIKTHNPTHMLERKTERPPLVSPWVYTKAYIILTVTKTHICAQETKPHKLLQRTGLCWFKSDPVKLNQFRSRFTIYHPVEVVWLSMPMEWNQHPPLFVEDLLVPAAPWWLTLSTASNAPSCSVGILCRLSAARSCASTRLP